MSDDAIAKRAEQWLKKTCDGNGLNPDKIQLEHASTNMETLAGVLNFRVQKKTSDSQIFGKNAQGQLVTSRSEAMARAEDFVTRFSADPQTLLSAVQPILQNDAAKGWDLPPKPLPLPGGRHVFSWFELCRICAGQGFTPCPNCANLPPNPSAPCPTCGGARRIGCGPCGQTGHQTYIYGVDYSLEPRFSCTEGTASPDLRPALKDIRALATRGEVEVTQTSLEPSSAALQIPLTAAVALTKATFSIQGAAVPALLIGMQGRIYQMPPILDRHVTPFLEDLEALSTGRPANLGGALQKVCSCRLIRETLQTAATQKNQGLYRFLRARYGVLLSEDTVKRITQLAERSLARLSRGPRLIGLAIGTAGAAAGAAGWYLSPLRSTARKMLETHGWSQHIIVGDMTVWVVGWVFSLMLVRILATRAIRTLMPPDVGTPLQRAGDTGLFALFTTLISWLAIAILAPTRPEWLVTLIAHLTS